jgi:hypothetical protein
MKKLSAILVGMSLVAGAVMAAGPVTSVNAVGYVNINLPAGKFVLAAVPFRDFKSSIDDVMWGSLTGTDDASTADRVWLFDSLSQSYKLYWKADGVGGGYDGHMIDPIGNIATNVFLSPGQAFWIQSQAAVDQVVVLKGEVPNELQATNAISAGFTLVGVPYSSSMIIGSNTTFFASGGVGSDDPSTSDKLYVFDTASQSYVLYWLANNVGAPYDGHFIDPSGNIATQSLDIAAGAWYLSVSNGFNWVDVRPYSSISQ